MKTKIYNKIIKVKLYQIVGLLLSAIIIGYIIHLSTHRSIRTTVDPHIGQSVNESTGTSTVWTCSMHPQIKQEKSGLCPICAMELVPMESGGSEEEGIDPNEVQMSESAIALASVQTAVVKKGIPEKTVQLLGRIKPDERNIAALTARFGGRIEKLSVNFIGQKVAKGQKLGTIYSPELISAQKELLEAAKFKESNPSFYKSARTKLKLWDLTETQIDAIVQKGEPRTEFEILSPIAGTVTQRHVAIGDYIKEGDALFEVVDLSRVWVMFDAYESDLPWMKKDNLIEFTIQSVPGKQYEGKVTYIDPFINPQSRIAQVRVELSNTDDVLKPEMFVNGILKSPITENSNELLIPKSAILWTGKRAVVYVKVPNRNVVSFVYREVVLGPEAGIFYVVAEGLREGEEIAVNGVFRIDASAQLAGKQSMMNPDGGMKMSNAHDHGDKAMEIPSTEKEATNEHSEFKVSGNCSMCKSTIETAAKALAGINFADWDQETKMFHVSFNAGKVKLDEIHQAIANAGYDTDKVSADKKAYDGLPSCCKYKE